MNFVVIGTDRKMQHSEAEFVLLRAHCSDQEQRDTGGAGPYHGARNLEEPDEKG